MTSNRDVRSTVYLQLLALFGLAATVLWPARSYYALLRYGGGPTIFTALPYVIPGGLLVAALYLGLTASPGKKGWRSFISWQFLTAGTLLALSLPYVALAFGIAGTPLARLPGLLLLLLVGLLLYLSLGAACATIVRLPTLRHAVGWSLGGAILHLSGASAPALNPVVAAANAIGIAGSGATTLWLTRLDPFPLAGALIIPLITAGALNTVVVLWRK